MSRNKVTWSKLTHSRHWVAGFIATAGGAGLIPKAPGTAGTLVGVAIVGCFALAEVKCEYQVIFWIVVFIAGLWAAKEWDLNQGTGDHQSIVIDEVLGYAVSAAIWIRPGGDFWGQVQMSAAPFILFRIFDIIKIFPVGNVDRWSKNASKSYGALGPWIGGFGVIADDLIAGLQALVCLKIYALLVH